LTSPRTARKGTSDPAYRQRQARPNDPGGLSQGEVNPSVPARADWSARGRAPPERHTDGLRGIIWIKKSEIPSLFFIATVHQHQHGGNQTNTNSSKNGNHYNSVAPI